MHSRHLESQATSSAKDRVTALLYLLGLFSIRRKLPLSACKCPSKKQGGKQMTNLLPNPWLGDVGGGGLSRARRHRAPRHHLAQPSKV